MVVGLAVALVVGYQFAEIRGRAPDTLANDEQVAEAETAEQIATKEQQKQK